MHPALLFILLVLGVGFCRHWQRYYSLMHPRSIQYIGFGDGESLIISRKDQSEFQAAVQQVLLIKGVLILSVSIVEQLGLKNVETKHSSGIVGLQWLSDVFDVLLVWIRQRNHCACIISEHTLGAERFRALLRHLYA